MSEQSKVNNCHLIRRSDDRSDYMFYFPDKGGDAYVNLDGYLICPADMFTGEEIDAAYAKYREKHGVRIEKVISLHPAQETAA